ncbi:MAG: 3-methylornithyl-N6-L-lysine dehydrogenase PylD [Candidatus Bathyarchaeota archaeon]|nr:MAG: 3-methylornithyl-N6-L-lysine dehydrogenase PylD [Candidatus Bathyarchaeota archaeon]
MTRLAPIDIKDIPNNLKTYDMELELKTGANLIQIAKNAAHAGNEVDVKISKTKAAVIPVTSGLGLISGFAEAVVAILTHIGVKAKKTNGNDVSGLAEAVRKKADLIFMADDDKFIAVNLNTQYIVDNSEATGRAYVTALDLASGSVQARSVLVIGVGKVGFAAIGELVKREATILIYDINEQKMEYVKKIFKDRVKIFHSVKEAMNYTNLVILAAPSKKIIHAGMITNNVIISAPAIPLGLTENALIRLPSRNLIHDPLQLGVATMALEAIVGIL